jgi:hypothetical protein
MAKMKMTSKQRNQFFISRYRYYESKAYTYLYLTIGTQLISILFGIFGLFLFSIFFSAMALPIFAIYIIKLDQVYEFASRDAKEAAIRELSPKDITMEIE